MFIMQEQLLVKLILRDKKPLEEKVSLLSQAILESAVDTALFLEIFQSLFHLVINVI